MVVDISDGGIRLRRYSDDRLPPRAAIYDHSDRTFRPAVVAWCRGDEVGLHFTDCATPATQPEVERFSDRSDLNSVYIQK